MATATFAKKAPRARTVAPQATTQAEVPAKASIWMRIKSAAKTVGTTIAKPFKAAARTIVPATKKAATAVANTAKKAVRSVKPMTDKVVAVAQRVWANPHLVRMRAFVQRAWTRSIRPFLRTMFMGTFTFLVLCGLAVAPLTTLLALGLGAALLFMFAAGLVVLEERENTSRIAKVVLTVLNGIALLLRAVVYAWTACFTVALIAQSLPAAITVFGLGLLVHMYRRIFRDLKAEFSTRTTETVTETSHQSTVIDTVAVSSTVRPSDAPNNPESWTRGNHLVAKGTEELWGTEHDVPAEGTENRSDVWQNDTACDACGTHEGAMRIRSMNVPFVTVGPNKGASKEDTSVGNMLCSACFDAECEEVAFALTGVSLKARSTEVRLNKTGIEHSPEFAASTFEPEKYFWLETGWWRDKHDTQYPREWACLVDGKTVLNVVHDHKRKVYRGSVLGRLVPNGVKKTLAEAQLAAQAEYEDEDRAVERIEQAASEIAGEAPKRAKKA